MRILGLSAYEQGGAAALIVDGRPVAAAAEEHYSRELGDPAFPRRAMRGCLRQAGLELSSVDRVVFHTKPLRRFERVLFQELTGFPKTAGSFSKQMATWLGDRLWVRGRISQEVGLPLDRVGFCNQSAAQACAALAAAGTREASVLVSDVHGEWPATCLFHATEGKLELLDEQHVPHGLAPFLTATAMHLGLASDDALEGLSDLARFAAGVAPDSGLGGLLSVDESSGSVRVADGVVAAGGDLGPGPALEELWGPARQAGAALEFQGGEALHAQRAKEALQVAAHVLECQARQLCERTGQRRLVIAGELAGHPALMSALATSGACAELHALPGAHHGFAALGAALFAAWFDGQVEEQNLSAELGVAPRLGEVLLDLDDEDLAPNSTEALGRASQVLSEGGVVAWVSGRSALGRQAHPGRVMLAPLDSAGLDRLRERVLRSEAHRLPAVAVSSETWSHWIAEPPPATGSGLERLWTPTAALSQACPELLAGDGRVRAQCWSSTEGEAAALLARSQGALLCAPLAGRGEPVVRSFEDARAYYERSELDLLVVEDRVIEAAPA